VEALGDGVTGFKVGDNVLYLGGKGYAEYIYAGPQELIPVPALKPELIATLITGLAASIGLDQAGRIKKGDKVLITAAAGGTGQTCVQWAKAKGCYVIGTTSSDEKGVFLTSLGCDKVINYRKEDLDASLTREFPDGVDVIWETIGGKTLEMLVKHLAVKGRMAIIGGISGYQSVGSAAMPAVAFNDLPMQMAIKSLSLSGFLVTNYADLFPDYLPKLIGRIMTGTLRIKVDNGEGTEGGPFKGIESATRANAHLHAGKNTGKVIIAL
jgi:NADPH-dependent curcumin reductase CurA